MTPRRVTRIITRLNIGGPSIQAINLSRELEETGFETRLLHGRLGPGEGDMRSILPAADLHDRYLPNLVRPISPIRDLAALWQIFRALCRWRPDIVHTHMAKAGALGRLAAVIYNRTAGARRPARLIHTYHGHVFEGYFGSPSTKVFLAIERWLARRTDALVAISPQVRRDLLETYGIAQEGQVRLIPLGFDLERLSAIGPAERLQARATLGIPDDTVVVTTVGRLTAIKQHTLLLAAAQQLAGRVERVVFLIVGDGELRAALEADVLARGLANHVRFLGWRGDLDTVYGATDIFVLTSRNEGTPVALIEAMASGVASVSTDVGGVRDVITDAAAGTLVPFGNPEALSDALFRYTQSLTARESAGRVARRLVLDKFDGRRLARDISELYETLLAQ